MIDYSEQRQTAQIDLQAIARDAQYLNKLPHSQVTRMVETGATEHFEQGDLLLGEGSQVEKVYLVLHGLVSVGLHRDSNPALWLYVSGPGAVVDMFALLDPPVSPVTIRALSDVDVLAIPQSIFAEVIGEEATVGYQILRDLCTKMSIINRVTLKEVCQEYPGPSRN